MSNDKVTAVHCSMLDYRCVHNLSLAVACLCKNHDTSSRVINSETFFVAHYVLKLACLLYYTS